MTPWCAWPTTTGTQVVEGTVAGDGGDADIRTASGADVDPAAIAVGVIVGLVIGVALGFGGGFLEALGHGARQGFGKRPALLIVDTNYEFCGMEPLPILEAIREHAESEGYQLPHSYAYSAYLAGWGTSTGEMSNTLNSLLVTPNKEKGVGTTNRSRYSNKEMDALVERSATLMDDAERDAVLAKASEMAMADFAMLPIHFEHSVWAMKKGIDFSGRADQMTMVRDVVPTAAK